MEKRKTSKKYSPKVRERAVRMALEHANDYAKVINHLFTAKTILRESS
ncbi:hypothetical protein SAMN05421828_1405 [Acidiphilium rubrum]|uniref:Transposase n=1 Tax=Acidiphilium rubrum TaxID=526 RepID=A0A8G2FI52_ACIRU|nr:hypothetical protein SAMN05421828_1405 [Acidiphilium rubrum]